MNWEEIEERALGEVERRGLGADYKNRLQFELDEINKQGANQYWLNIINANKKFKSNPNYLVLPWLFNLVEEDPIRSRQSPLITSSNFDKVMKYIGEYGTPVDIVKDQDMPDIDLDCLPEARDPIKKYAIAKYNESSDEYGSVCSVGTWQSYLFRSAVEAVVRATGVCDLRVVQELMKSLPDDVDDIREGGVSQCKGKVKKVGSEEEKECDCVHGDVKCPKCGSEETEHITIGKLLQEYETLADFHQKHPEVIEYALRLIGRIRTMGMHAGAVIITDRPLYGNVPMVYRTKTGTKDGYWVSLWTEGRTAQLSKFGYNKWDILGLKNLKYVFRCCELIEKNRGIRFGNHIKVVDADGNESIVNDMSGWDDIDPTDKDGVNGRAGIYYDKDGNVHKIDLDDYKALSIANNSQTDAVFQFDTDLAKSILANGVRSFNDLVLLNAMGHPGPMACCWSHSNINIDGGIKRIDQLDNNVDAIAYYTQDNSIAFTKSYAVVKTGVKKLKKITFKDGNVLFLSDDHQLLSNSGYKRVVDLVAGDMICRHQNS